MGHGLDAQNRNNEVEVQFSYDMPDAYLYQTTTEGKVGTWTYKGPKEMWVFVEKQTTNVQVKLDTDTKLKMTLYQRLTSIWLKLIVKKILYFVN